MYLEATQEKQTQTFDGHVEKMGVLIKAFFPVLPSWLVPISAPGIRYD
jgi:hypothetical protein